MERLTKKLLVIAMGMYELAHNDCYIGDNKVAMYRDFEQDENTRDYIRRLMFKYGSWEEEDEEMQDDDAFDYTMFDNLQYAERSIEGLIALLYKHMWSKADLHENLKQHEDTGFTPEQVVEMTKELAEYKKLDEQGLLLKLPCKVGDTVYTLNTLKNKKIVLGQIEEIDDFFIALCMMENRFGKTVFLTKEAAEAKLKEMEGK